MTRPKSNGKTWNVTKTRKYLDLSPWDLRKAVKLGHLTDLKPRDESVSRHHALFDAAEVRAFKHGYERDGNGEWQKKVPRAKPQPQPPDSPDPPTLVQQRGTLAEGITSRLIKIDHKLAELQKQMADLMKLWG